jgi:hypothetical protein
MEELRNIRGKILVVSGKEIFFSRGLTIYKSENDGVDYEIFCKLKKTGWTDYVAFSHLTTRLFRSGVHHLVPCEDGFFVFYNKCVAKLTDKGDLVGVCEIKGSRPLCVTLEENRVLFGEYCNNATRSSVDIFSYDGVSLGVEYTFTGVRHIHGVFKDKYTGKVYVTTGDYGDEAGIWVLEEGIAKLLSGGGQQKRAVQLLFTDEYIYYGTDSPIEKNFIYRIKKSSGESERLGSVCSSIFYGVLVNGVPYFCSVAEPSTINPENKVALYRVGSCGVEEVSCFGKDFFSKKYFQYGQLNFPCYLNDFRKEKNLWYYKLSVKGSGHSILVSMSE